MKNHEKSLFDPLMFPLLKVTEAAALAASYFIGKGDEKKADQAAVDAMRKAFDQVPIQGVIVIGEGERDEAPMLYIGEKVGKGDGPKMDIAVDPLEGTTLTAKARPNALSVMALAETGNLLNAPDVYMEKIAVGPHLPKDVIDLSTKPQKNIMEVAKAKKKDVQDVVVCVLERPRHEALIAQIRETGARLMLISDGDIGAVIAATLPEGGVDLYMGSGGAPEGVLAAAALATLGGQMQGQLLFKKDEEKERGQKLGIQDFNHIYTQSEMAKGEILFIATGVTDGTLLKGVQTHQKKSTLHSLILHSATKSSYFVHSQHYF